MSSVGYQIATALDRVIDRISGFDKTAFWNDVNEGRISKLPFETSLLDQARDKVATLMQEATGLRPSLNFPNHPDDQGIQFGFLEFMGRCLADEGVDICKQIYEGAPLGVHGELPPSNVYPPRSKAGPIDFDASEEPWNYTSVDHDPDKIERILNEGADLGFWHQPMTEDAARKLLGRPPQYLPMVAIVEPQKTRIVVDATRGGLNGKGHLKEIARTPSIGSAVEGMQLMKHLFPVGFKLDVSKAYRRVNLAKQGRYMACVCVNEKVYVPRAHRDGQVAISWWWMRLASFFHRIAHKCVPEEHASFVYVDDSFWMTSKDSGLHVLPRLLLLWAISGIPLNYGKMQNGSTIKWLGFIVDLTDYTLSTPVDKMNSVRELLARIAGKRYVARKVMERILWKIIWMGFVLPQGKPFLQRAFIPLKQKGATLRISKQLRGDLAFWWQLCGVRPTRIPALFIPRSPWTIVTDASPKGLGGLLTFEGQDRKSIRWLHCPLTTDEIEWISEDICPPDTPAQHLVSALEMCGILVMLILAGPLLGKACAAVTVREDGPSGHAACGKQILRQDGSAGISLALADSRS